MADRDRISESLRLGTLLTLTGGFLDAYSYLVRGHVFANAETGNIVLMGINMAHGDFGKVLYYLIPVVSFAVGVFAAELIQKKIGENRNIYWKEAVLVFEIILLFLAGLIPQEGNSVVNSMIAFICAMQVEAFRKVQGKPFATTMCTGNLRSGTELLALGIFGHDTGKIKNALQYYWIDLTFIIGAAIGVFVCGRFEERAVWFCILTLLASIIFIHKKVCFAHSRASKS